MTTPETLSKAIYDWLDANAHGYVGAYGFYDEENCLTCIDANVPLATLAQYILATLASEASSTHS